MHDPVEIASDHLLLTKQRSVEMLLDHFSSRAKGALVAPAYPYVAAAHNSGPQTKPITRLVVHDEEYPVSNHSAEDVAALFSRPSSGGSAHLVFDSDGGVRCVPDNIIAWHAPPNDGSLGAEHDGYARFSAQDWQTPGSQATLHVSALGFAYWAQHYGIPVKKITVADLLAGRRGFCGHVDVTNAYHQSTHTDPGLHFPWDQFLGLVDNALASHPVTPPAPKPHVPGYPGYVLAVGAAGQVVLAVQKRLQALGFYHGRLDSQYGPVTVGAVTAFQKKTWPRTKAQWDGKVGPTTWAKLFPNK